jgi:hypothetical protein
MSAVAKLAKVVSLRLFRESASTPVVDPAQVFDTPDPYVDRLYARNLRTLKALSEHLGAYAIFVPQVLNDHYYFKNQTSSRPDAGSVIANGVTVHLWTPRIANAAMPRLMHRFNKIMLTVCRPGDRQCTVLQDVEAAGWGPRDFIDAGHFSREGGHKLAEMTAKLITAHYADQQGSPGRTQRPARPAPKRSF